MSGQEARDDSWREKYYDALGELETKEQNWRRLEERLRQCVSRLSLVAEAAGHGFGGELSRLREAIRAGRDGEELDGLLASLDRHLTEFEQQKEPASPARTARDLLINLTERFSLPGAFGRKQAKISKRLNSVSSEAECREQADALAALITEALAASADQGGGSTGLFARFRGGREASPDIEAARAILTQLIQRLIGQESVDGKLLSDRVAAATRADELISLAEDLGLVAREYRSVDSAEPGSGETLLRLVERLAIPEELQSRAESIKADLVQALDETAINRAVAAVADLVTAIRARVQGEKEEIERFLKQVTEHLRELDLNLQRTVADQRDRERDGRQLDAAVADQVSGIEASVREASDIGGLKALVQERVSTIRRHMDSFRQAEEARTRRAEAEVEKLSSRLAEMESESSALRERVRAEREQALVDPLTEIGNRLAYNERIAQEFARWKRYRNPLVFAVWDVDRFKGVNDTYGHQAGDKVLRVVAKVLSSRIRETDFLARYGGEEFVLLLPDTDPDEARGVIEKLRAAVEACDFKHRKEPVRITISCGVAVFGDGDEPDAVFARADAALYRAKEEGRNRCVFAEEVN